MRLLELLAMLGAVQGVLLLFLVVVRFRHRRNVPFALLLLTFSLRLGTTPSWNPDALLTGRWLLTLVGPLPLLFGPLVWWYVRELSRGGNAMPRFLPLHGVPWLLETAAVSLIVYSMDAGEYFLLLESVFAGNPPWWMTARHIGKVVIGGAYAVAAGRIAFGAESRARAAAGEQVFWVRVVVIAPLLSLLAFGVVAILPEISTARGGVPLAGGDGFSPLLIPEAIMMVTIYLFSMLVLVAPGLLTEPCGTPPSVPVSDADDGGAYPASRNDLSAEDLELSAQVRRALEEGVFRESELTLVQLADRLEVRPNHLSAVVNRAFGENFCRLINRYRLDYFLDRVDRGLPPGVTILELALEAGFPSKSTFNRFFKARTGVAPSVYLEERQHDPGQGDDTTRGTSADRLDT
jgi:AraC-like DNA-binding protein